MAIFDPLSRYVTPPVTPYRVIDIRGREVLALPTPEPPIETPVGRHVKKEGQNLDQLAASYLGDPHAYWRIAEVNDAVVPDALAEETVIDIPAPTR
jgi:hypothetical protein